MESPVYCARCGDAVDPKAAKCGKCGKSLPAKDHLFLQFLIDHTKDSIKGDIEDSIFETIKNFLLSHLYGVIVGISLVVVAGVTVFANDPAAHIEQVDGIPTEAAVILSPSTPSTPSAATLSEADQQAIEQCMTGFATSLDIARFQAGNEAFLYLISDELYETLTTEADYSLYYNYYDEELFPYVKYEDGPTNKVVFHEGTLTTEATTPNGQDLAKRGYAVASAYITHSLYATAVDPNTPVASAKYLVTFVKENDGWYIVETINAPMPREGGAQG